VFYLPEPYRIVIDIARHPPGAASHGHRVIERVVLDPGHGGSDPGAIGPSGVREKDVTLDIARKIAPLLAKDGVSVVLTREDDRFVPLEDRTARANAFGADLFVSIHCNAAENRGRHGVETYVLDTTKDDIASRVAARENAMLMGDAMRAAWEEWLIAECAVEPVLIVEVAFSEWTHAGHVRQPTYEGLREDKSPVEVHRERPAEVSLRAGRRERPHRLARRRVDRRDLEPERDDRPVARDRRPVAVRVGPEGRPVVPLNRCASRPASR